MKTIDDRDAVAIALYYVLERYILGHERKKFVSYNILKVIEKWDTKTFQEYPWGSVTWKVLFRSMSDALHGRLEKYKQCIVDEEGHQKEEKYSLEGYTTAIQVG